MIQYGTVGEVNNKHNLDYRKRILYQIESCTTDIEKDTCILSNTTTLKETHKDIHMDILETQPDTHRPTEMKTHKH